MKEIGAISKIVNSGVSEIRFEKSAVCARCKACLAAEGGYMVAEAWNHVEGRVGDRVEVEIPSGKMMWAAFLIFILPVIGLIAGYLFGVSLAPGFGFHNAEISGVVTGLIFMALVFGLVKLFDWYLAKGGIYRFNIIRVLQVRLRP